MIEHDVPPSPAPKIPAQPAKRKRGRPRKTVAEKRAKRNRREREQRVKQTNKLGRAKRATSPFERGLALLEGQRTGAHSSPRRAHHATAQALAIVGIAGGLRHSLTQKEQNDAAILFTTIKERNIQGFAPNTRSTMACDWRHWQAFCLECDRQVLPVEPNDLMDFFTALADAGYQRAAIEHHLVTLRLVSKLYNLPDLMQSMVLRLFWKSLCTTRLVKAQKQAHGLTLEMLERMGEAIDPTNAVDRRDFAMACVAYDGMLRAAELVQLHATQIVDCDSEGALVRLGRTKVDREGKGETRALRPETRDAIADWRRHAATDVEALFQPIPIGRGRVKPKVDPAKPKKTKPLAPRVADGPTGGMTVKAVTAALLRLAKRAGFEKLNLSGHSSRVGATQDQFEWKVPLGDILFNGRWKSPTMALRYGANRSALNAGTSRFEAMRAHQRKHEAPAAATKGTAPASIMVLRVELAGINPPIWRSLQVRAESTLAELHWAICGAMGWCGDHLFEIFGADGQGYTSNPSGGSSVPGTTAVGALLKDAGDALRYHYDFGDNWWHTVTLDARIGETNGALYPRCVGGARACPPEDCGGVGGYLHLLSSMARPRSAEYRSWRERLDEGGEWPFHPDRFDKNKLEFVGEDGWPRPNT